jgi:hypothetical protein
MECGISGTWRQFEIEPADKLAGLLGAEVPVHAGVGPFHGQRPLIADFVKRG